MKVLVGALIALSTCGPAFGATDRPPQFVLMAFDNCTELEHWREVSALIDELGQDEEGKSRLRFTFFLSGVNFLADKYAHLYSAPGQAAGKANIAFGGDPKDVEARVALINEVHRKGGEMGSHAVGHFWGEMVPAARATFLPGHVAQNGPDHSGCKSWGLSIAFCKMLVQTTGYPEPCGSPSLLRTSRAFVLPS